MTFFTFAVPSAVVVSGMVCCWDATSFVGQITILRVFYLQGLFQSILSQFAGLAFRHELSLPIP